MTREETITRIAERLAELDDDAVSAVASIVESYLGSDLPRPLTARELALIEQSKEDFRHGRTYNPEEARAFLDAELERRRKLRAS